MSFIYNDKKKNLIKNLFLMFLTKQTMYNQNENHLRVNLDELRRNSFSFVKLVYFENDSN